MTVEDFRESETWRVFRIMSEFVEGFETLSKISPAISCSGASSSRTVESVEAPDLVFFFFSKPSSSNSTTRSWAGELMLNSLPACK